MMFDICRVKLELKVRLRGAVEVCKSFCLVFAAKF